MVNLIKNKRGFTLTETMIVLMILGVVVMIGPTVATQLTRFFLLSQTRLELQREARSAISLMTRNLRQASASTIRIDQVTGQPYYSRIQFTTVQGRALLYRQNGNQLLETVGTRSTILSKNLRFLTFTFPRSDDMTIVSVAFTLEKNLYQGRKKALHMASERIQVMNP